MDTDGPVSPIKFNILHCRPEVWFAIRMLKSLQMMEIPLLKSWIHSLVMDGLTQALVDPGKIDIAVETSGPTYAPAKSRSRSKGKSYLPPTVWGKAIFSQESVCPRGGEG